MYRDSKIFDENLVVIKYAHNYFKNLNYSELPEFIRNLSKLI